MEPTQVFNLYDMSFDDVMLMLSQHQPWWVYLVVALIPLSITLVARELLCWFWKLSRIARRLDRIEYLLMTMLEQSSAPIQPPAPRPAPTTPRPAPRPVPVSPPKGE